MIRITLYVVAICYVVAMCPVLTRQSHAINWNREEALTEEGRIRNEYLSKAGTLPAYYQGLPTGETYHGNCCGFGDAYEADDFSIDDKGNLWAILTCNDPDNCKEVPGKETCGPDDEGNQVCSNIGGKIVRPPGSKFLVTPDKILINRSPVNVTGHGWVYISPYSVDNIGQPV